MYILYGLTALLLTPISASFLKKTNTTNAPSPAHGPYVVNWANQYESELVKLWSRIIRPANLAMVRTHNLLALLQPTTIVAGASHWADYQQIEFEILTKLVPLILIKEYTTNLDSNYTEPGININNMELQALFSVHDDAKEIYIHKILKYVSHCSYTLMKNSPRLPSPAVYEIMAALCGLYQFFEPVGFVYPENTIPFEFIGDSDIINSHNEVRYGAFYFYNHFKIAQICLQHKCESNVAMNCKERCRDLDNVFNVYMDAQKRPRDIISPVDEFLGYMTSGQRRLNIMLYPHANFNPLEQIVYHWMLIKNNNATDLFDLVREHTFLSWERFQAVMLRQIKPRNKELSHAWAAVMPQLYVIHIVRADPAHKRMEDYINRYIRDVVQVEPAVIAALPKPNLRLQSRPPLADKSVPLVCYALPTFICNHPQAEIRTNLMQFLKKEIPYFHFGGEIWINILNMNVRLPDTCWHFLHEYCRRVPKPGMIFFEDYFNYWMQEAGRIWGTLPNTWAGFNNPTDTKMRTYDAATYRQWNALPRSLKQNKLIHQCIWLPHMHLMFQDFAIRDTIPNYYFIIRVPIDSLNVNALLHEWLDNINGLSGLAALEQSRAQCKHMARFNNWLVMDAMKLRLIISRRLLRAQRKYSTLFMSSADTKQLNFIKDTIHIMKQRRRPSTRIAYNDPYLVDVDYTKAKF